MSQNFDVASIVFVNKGGHLIFQMREDKPGIRNPGMVTAWGGAVEGEESPLQAAKREVSEETNLKPSESNFEKFGTYRRVAKIDGRQVVNHVFLLKHVDESKLQVFEGEGFIVVNPSKDIKNVKYTELTSEIIADYFSRLK